MGTCVPPLGRSVWLRRSGMGVGGIDDEIRACSFRLVHEHVGVLQQQLGAGAWVGEDNADADREVIVDASAEGHRPGEFGANPFRHAAQLLRVVHAGAEHREFVPAESGRGVSWPDGSSDAPCHCLQHLIPFGVAPRIVHRFETIKVEVESMSRVSWILGDDPW